MKKILPFALLVLLFTAGKAVQPEEPQVVAKKYICALFDFDTVNMKRYGDRSYSMKINLAMVKQGMANKKKMSESSDPDERAEYAEGIKAIEQIKKTMKFVSSEYSDDRNEVEIEFEVSGTVDGETETNTIPVGLKKNSKGAWKVSYFNMF